MMGGCYACRRSSRQFPRGPLEYHPELSICQRLIIPSQTTE
jgi:hypothetical protein